MHHHVSAIVVFAVEVERFAAQENTGVRVHGCLVRRDGPVKLPHDDGFWVVEEVMADAGDVFDEGNLEGFELSAGADARQK